jgi:hypothetical protein
MEKKRKRRVESFGEKGYYNSETEYYFCHLDYLAFGKVTEEYRKLGNPLGDNSKEYKIKHDKWKIEEHRKIKDRIDSRFFESHPHHTTCRADTTTRLRIRCMKMVNPNELYCFWHKPKA